MVSKAFSDSPLQDIFVGSFEGLFWVVLSGDLLLALAVAQQGNSCFAMVLHLCRKALKPVAVNFL